MHYMLNSIWHLFREQTVNVVCVSGNHWNREVKKKTMMSYLSQKQNTLGEFKKTQ